MEQTKMRAGARFPDFTWPAVAGEPYSPAKMTGWRALIVYRGKHCPLCKTHLDTLNEMRDDFAAANVQVAAISADTKEKAEAEAAECGWKFPVAYDLSVEHMRELGLHVSDPRSPEETDRPFAEPGLFVINPEGNVQIIDVSNAPFARPELSSTLKGLRFVISKDYPIRGLA